MTNRTIIPLFTLTREDVMVFGTELLKADSFVHIQIVHIIGTLYCTLS